MRVGAKKSINTSVHHTLSRAYRASDAPALFPYAVRVVAKNAFPPSHSISRVHGFSVDGEALSSFESLSPPVSDGPSATVTVDVDLASWSSRLLLLLSRFAKMGASLGVGV